MALIKCDQCGIDFEKKIYPSRKSKNNFCSVKCRGIFQRNKVSVVCDYCGELFYRSKSRFKNNNHNFCSRKCIGKFNRDRNIKNSIGKKYNNLTILSAAYIKKGDIFVNAKCSCGKVCIKNLRSVKEGKTKTCGRCISDKERFMSKIKIIDDKTWIWEAYKDKKGYGTFRYKGRQQKAHRVAYQLFVGEIPEGMCVCHKFDDPANVCPSSLFLGFNSDNVADKVAKGRCVSLKGENNPSSVLNDEIVLKIRELYENNDFTYAALGRMFDVSYITIKRVVNREYWTHI